jgi:hypothetical protein
MFVLVNEKLLFGIENDNRRGGEKKLKDIARPSNTAASPCTVASMNAV